MTISGGLVFMYIQCKVYIQICRKWRAYNRTIVVQDLPQDVIEKQKKAILEARKPGKEDTVWISSDSEGELNEVKYSNYQPVGGARRAGVIIDYRISRTSSRT